MGADTETNENDDQEYNRQSRALEPDDLRQLTEMWIAGAPSKYIAEKLGIAQRTVTYVVSRLRAKGVPLPKRRHGPGQSIYNDDELIEDLTQIVEGGEDS